VLNNPFLRREYIFQWSGTARTMQRKYFTYPIRFYGSSNKELCCLGEPGTKNFGYHVLHPSLPFFILRTLSPREETTQLVYFKPINVNTC
jgi:hypothetical protein